MDGAQVGIVIRDSYSSERAIKVDGSSRTNRDDADMKPFIALVVLLFSFAAHAAPRVSADVSHASAELMGDVVYFQVDNSAKARARLALLLGNVDAAAARSGARGGAQAAALADAVRSMLASQVNRSPYEAVKYKAVVEIYEAMVQGYGPEAVRDQEFLVLDLRFRYLSRTLSMVNDGTIITFPLLRSLEEAFEDADRAMKEVAARNPEAARKWGFLRPRVLDYNNAAIPALANNMTLRIAGDFRSGGEPLVATASR